MQENARVYSKVIMEAVVHGSDPKEIMRIVGDDFRRRSGRRLAKEDIDILVAGYSGYFKGRKMLA